MEKFLSILCGICAIINFTSMSIDVFLGEYTRATFHLLLGVFLLVLAVADDEEGE